jgi:primary-amine oxidase
LLFKLTSVVSYVWSPIPRNTMRLERSFVENEDDGKINWPTNGAAMYVVVNTDEPNIYGEYPGYRILPGNNCKTIF